MISDVLWQALEDIKWYEQNRPAAYADLRDEIKHVKDVMRELQLELDTPPPYQKFPLRKKVRDKAARTGK